MSTSDNWVMTICYVLFFLTIAWTISRIYQDPAEKKTSKALKKLIKFYFVTPLVPLFIFLVGMFLGPGVALINLALMISAFFVQLFLKKFFYAADTLISFIFACWLVSVQTV